jgi:hypothetical protein
MFVLLFKGMIESGYLRKVVKTFLLFQVRQRRIKLPGLVRLVLWRAGLFYGLSARETCPLRCSSRLFEAGSQGFPHR